MSGSQEFPRPDTPSCQSETAGRRETADPVGSHQAALRMRASSDTDIVEMSGWEKDRTVNNARQLRKK